MEKSIDELQRQRNLLSAEFEALYSKHRRATSSYAVAEVYSGPVYDDDDKDDFCDLDGNDPPESPSANDPANVTPVDCNADSISAEKWPIVLPSTCFTQDHPLCRLEFVLRKQQAHRYITALQEVIAEKSFQFTHVIWHAPRKAVEICACAVIAKLNTKIALYAKVYGRCRAALLRLGADGKTMKIFRPLTKDDLSASGAIKDPNAPGSTSLQLSWIWQMSAAEETSSAHLHESERAPASHLWASGRAR